MSNSSFENDEDKKLEVLANATLRRTDADQAAALRDETGRTYVAINIATKTFYLDAIEAVFTIAMTSQIVGIEAVVIVGDGPINTALIREFAPAALIWYVSQNGEIKAL